MITRSNEYLIPDNLHILGNIMDLSLQTNDKDFLEQVHLIRPISYQYSFFESESGTSYNATSVLNGKLYGFRSNKFHEFTLKTFEQKQKNGRK